MHDDLFDNPYLPAKTTISTASDDAQGDSILSRWEKLRLWYNGGLVLEVVFLIVITGLDGLRNPVLYLDLIVGTFCANLCFCLGAVAEFYLIKLGRPHKAVTMTLFLTGLLLAMGLTAAIVTECQAIFHNRHVAR